MQVARLGVPYVLMHMRGDPTTMQLPANTDYPLGTIEGVADELRAAAGRAISAGIEPWRLILDPGEPSVSSGMLWYASNWSAEGSTTRRCGGRDTA